MLSRIMARIITPGTQNMAGLLGDSPKHLGHNNSSNIYVVAIEYLNSPFSVVNLARKDIETEGRILQCIRLFRNLG